jgi:large subunit ribosomal protein L22
MNAIAHARFIRQSPFKVRAVLDQVRGLTAAEAKVTLEFSDRRAADPVLKCLDSAIANMNTKYDLNDDLGNLAQSVTVATAFADEGPTLKRFRPRARGRASSIHKRTSHISIMVSDGQDEEETE